LKLNLDLAAHERRVYSQNGEDGVIERLFEVIGTTNKFCVEFGVRDGEECNTRQLLLSLTGWAGLWFDGVSRPGIQREHFTTENVNLIFATNAVPLAFDLLSIDIDGNDYWVFCALEFRPRVVVIEYNASVPPTESRTIAYDPAHRWDGSSDYYGASLLALERLGRRKGYTLVYCESRGVNAFFVETEIVERLGLEVEPFERLYRGVRPGDEHRHEGAKPWVEVEQDG